MKRAHRLSLLLGVLVLCTTSWSAQAQLAYRLQRIDNPSGSNWVNAATGLNNKGEVVGTLNGRGFHWKNGVYTDLQTATGSTATSMVPAGINDRSIIVGNQDVEPRNFMIRHGQLLPVKIDGGGSITAINNRNQIVGMGQTGGQIYPFIWERGKTTYLPRLPDSDNYVTHVVGINDRGVVAGQSGIIKEILAVIWKDGHVISLGLPDETTDSVAMAINNFDQVVGDASSRAGGRAQAFLSRSAGLVELPPPAGATQPRPLSINDWGVVVGESMSQDGHFIATLWVAGEAYDLNDLLDANEPLRDQVRLARALLINERGQIVAEGTGGAFLLTATYRAPALP